MITIRPTDERGFAMNAWLNTKYTFSFADYRDPKHMGFRKLRVINEDIVAPGSGFPPHDHHDMEIITYILSGSLQHKDSLGHAYIIEAGEVQRMSAGSGITHSEMNPSPTDPVHLLQIWILPDQRNVVPDYEKRFFKEEHQDQLRLLVSPDGRDESLKIHQNVLVYAGIFATSDGKTTYSLKTGRYAWIQVCKGVVKVNSQLLNQGDGAAISNEQQIEIEGAPEGEILLFDLD